MQASFTDDCDCARRSRGWAGMDTAHLMQQRVGGGGGGGGGGVLRPCMQHVNLQASEVPASLSCSCVITKMRCKTVLLVWAVCECRFRQPSCEEASAGAGRQLAMPHCLT